VGELSAIGFVGIEGDLRALRGGDWQCPIQKFSVESPRVSRLGLLRSDLVSVLDRRWPGATLLNSAAKSLDLPAIVRSDPEPHAMGRTALFRCHRARLAPPSL